MIIEFIHPLTGKVVKELRISSKIRLSDIVESLLKELKVMVDTRSLEPYYLVVVNGNQLNEGTSWDKVLIGDEDHIILMPFASGGMN